MSTSPLFQPIFFTPIYKDYLWGGTNIAKRFKRLDTPVPCAESWEISAHKDGMSIVSDGALKGQSLAELAKTFGRELLGSRSPAETKFPLLIKIIDARENLSVQIHPSLCDITADKDEIKNECWYSLNGEGVLFGGFQDPFNKRETFELACATDDSSFGGMLAAHYPSAGEVLNVPAGLVHAIGAGSLIYEVQQSSNTTYRFYDWGRVDAQGNPRELHIAQAMRSIDWSIEPSKPTAPSPIAGSPLQECIKTPYFRICKLQNSDTSFTVEHTGESFYALFASKGGFSIIADGCESRLPLGASALIPAALLRFTLVPDDNNSEVLITTL